MRAPHLLPVLCADAGTLRGLLLCCLLTGAGPGEWRPLGRGGGEWSHQANHDFHGPRQGRAEGWGHCQEGGWGRESPMGSVYLGGLCCWAASVVAGHPGRPSCTGGASHGCEACWTASPPCWASVSQSHQHCSPPPHRLEITHLK